MAKAMTTVQVWCRSDLSDSIGSTTAASSANSAMTCGNRLTHQIERSRSGTAPADHRHENQDREEQHELHESGLGGVVEEQDTIDDADRNAAEHGPGER